MLKLLKQGRKVSQMTKRNPEHHRRMKGFNIPRLPKKPAHARNLEEGERIGQECNKKVPVRPGDYLIERGIPSDHDRNQLSLTELIK